MSFGTPKSWLSAIVVVASFAVMFVSAVGGGGDPATIAIALVVFMLALASMAITI